MSDEATVKQWHRDVGRIIAEMLGGEINQSSESLAEDCAKRIEKNDPLAPVIESAERAITMTGKRLSEGELRDAILWNKDALSCVQRANK